MSNHKTDIYKKLLAYHNNSDLYSDQYLDQLIEIKTETKLDSSYLLDLIDNYGPEHRTYQADSPYDIVGQIYKIITQFKPKSILDIGSGNGRVLFYGAHLLSNIEFHGIEMVTKRALYCQQQSQKVGLKINFINGDATKVDLPKVECMILINSLFPSLMPKLIKHLKKHAESNPFTILSASTCNIIISKQDWLQEIQLSPPPKNDYDLRLFRSIV